MKLTRAIARPMLASMFIYGGLDSVRDPKSKAAAAQGTADLITKTTGRQFEPADLVRFNGAVHVVAGAALATGRFPRLAALTLAATLGPTTSGGHRFWDEMEPGPKRNQTIHFLKNVSMTGGLLMATLDPGPKKKQPRRASDNDGKAKKWSPKKTAKRRN